MNEFTLDKIEDLLNTYVYAYDDYVRSQTCCNATYKQQEEAIYNARYELLNFISEKLKG